MSRYLNPDEERALKAELETLYATATNSTNNGLDILIVPYLKRLNAISGVATEQSCQGHSLEIDGEICYDSGVLWVRLSEEKYWRFLEIAHELFLPDEWISVSVYIADFGGRHDLVEIQFSGSGKGPIDRTMEHITRFFENLDNKDN